MSTKILLDTGIAQAIKGDWKQAEALFRQAIEENPECAEAYYNLGAVYREYGRLSDAEQCLRRAAELRPDNPEIFFNLGVVQAQAKHHQDAAKSFCRAIELNPNSSEAFFNLGVVQAGDRLLAAAERSFRRALELNPDFPRAYYNLGLVLKDEERLEEAISCFRRAVELKSDYAAAYNNLGLVLKSLNRLSEAEECLRKALGLDPKYLPIYNNLAAVLKDLGRLSEAEAYLRKALELNPGYAQSYNLLGVVLTELNRLDEAAAALQQAVALKGHYPEAEFSLGIIQLLEGRFDQGWRKFELRRRLFECYKPEIRLWQGEDLTGCRILLFHEQGFGDTIQFARYAYKVADLAAETVLWVREPLAAIFADAAGGVKVHTGESITSQFNYACPLLSLPYVFSTIAATIPQNVPYLWPNQGRVDKWLDYLNKVDDGGRVRIGVVWGGNPKHTNDRNRSVPFTLFSKLFAINQVSWISLQVGRRAEELAQAAGAVQDVSSGLADFAETAGVIANLDLVIAVDTAVAHLAGAMGKKTWVLLPFAPDWRWQLRREDSPWYPTMRLFRQRQSGDWQDVINRVEAALHLYMRGGIEA